MFGKYGTLIDYCTVRGPVFRHTYSLYAVEDGLELSIRPEVLCTMKGFRSDGPLFEKANVNYIEAPVLAKAAFLLNLPVVSSALVGPAVGFSMEPKFLNSNGDETAGLDLTFFDYGVVFGAGVETVFGLDIDARFNPELMDINDNYVKNRTISLMTSYGLC